MKYYNYKGTKVRLEAEEYLNGGTLAVSMYTEDGEPYSTITTNLRHSLQSDCRAFVDTNNVPDIEAWLEHNHIAVPTHVYAQSGFCTYPLYTFNTAEF